MPSPSITDPDKQLRTAILSHISGSDRKISPIDLERWLRLKFGFDKKTASLTIRRLVESCEIRYTNRFGRTFLEKSFERAVRVSPHIVLKPSGIPYSGQPDDTVIELLHGASFGTGEHPTTRLALQIIDEIFTSHAQTNIHTNASVLDIGTGSGVLVIASVLLGMADGISTDIDPCAIAEATANINLNGVSDRISVSNRGTTEIDGSFALVTANLRYPTLINISTSIQSLTQPGAIVVLSGIRHTECEQIIYAYGKRFFDCIIRRKEKGWSALAMKKNVAK